MIDINYHGPVLVFDLDDTLFRERDYCRSGFRHILKNAEKTLEAVPDSLFEEMNDALTARLNPFDVYERTLKPLYEAKGEEWKLDRHIALYRSHLPEISLVDGARELLDSLQAAGIKTGIVTDGRSLSQRNKIKALGLDVYMPDCNILISEETGCDKTSPEPFSHFVRQYPEARQFIYIGDNPAKDFFNPNLLGWTTVMVARHPDNVHPQALPDDSIYHPQITVESLRDIKKII